MHQSSLSQSNHNMHHLNFSMQLAYRRWCYYVRIINWTIGYLNIEMMQEWMHMNKQISIIYSVSLLHAIEWWDLEAFLCNELNTIKPTTLQANQTHPIATQTTKKLRERLNQCLKDLPKTTLQAAAKSKAKASTKKSKSGRK